MMGKIAKGGSFGGCVDYVTRKKKDKPDGSPCDEWRLIDWKDVSVIEGREDIIKSFEDNRDLNPALKNPVGHISLNFHANDKNKIDDNKMVEIARKYMDRMGIVDTPYIVVRHLDKEYPHCHIVFSRIDNHAETISDKNDFDRNRKVCLDLTKEYGLHISEGKRQTNVNKLRGTEKIRYEIFNAVEEVWNDKSVYALEQFEARLKAAGVGIEYKCRRGSNEVQGLWYTRKGKRFAASKIEPPVQSGQYNQAPCSKQTAASAVAMALCRRHNCTVLQVCWGKALTLTSQGLYRRTDYQTRWMFWRLLHVVYQIQS